MLGIRGKSGNRCEETSIGKRVKPIHDRRRHYNSCPPQCLDLAPIAVHAQRTFCIRQIRDADEATVRIITDQRQVTSVKHVNGPIGCNRHQVGTGLKVAPVPIR